ncbi:MAG: IS5 family transposase [Loktanella salsilacus]|jgi:IS5 family transposase
MEKNIAHPTDARLYDKARRQLVALADDAGVTLRQNYNRLAPRLALQTGRYAHARQFKRMRKALKQLKGYTGRVLRDLRRQLDAIPEGPLRERVLDKLVLVGRLLHQEPKSRGKIYALHEPEVDCISKGKARKRYEFGTKFSLATTIDEGFVVDRGCRGHGVLATQVLISGTRRGLTPKLKRLLRRRSAIEPEIGHMKNDGRLSRCPLKGTTGDAIFAVLCGCGHNIRNILAHIRALLTHLIAVFAGVIEAMGAENCRANRQSNAPDVCSA